MKLFLAVITGGVTSMAWLAPKPWYYLLAILSLVLFIITRELP